MTDSHEPRDLDPEVLLDPDDQETDEEINDFLGGFALRFDGYRYATSRGNQDLLLEWTTRFVNTLEMADEPNENHAAFFALQRFLGKWGGEMLTEESREHLAYRLLFLHLYHEDIPAEFICDFGQPLFRRLDLSRLESVAARVRGQLIALTLKHGNPLRPD